MTTLIYIGPFDEVEISATGQTCERGAQVDVDDDVAGRAPYGDPDDADYDPGEGLLAQTTNWTTDAPPAPPKKRPKKKTDDTQDGE